MLSRGARGAQLTPCSVCCSWEAGEIQSLTGKSHVPFFRQIGNGRTIGEQGTTLRHNGNDPSSDQERVFRQIRNDPSSDRERPSTTSCREHMVNRAVGCP